MSALRQAELDFHSIASPASFRSEPELAWGFHGHRLALYRRTVPHAGFALLKSWGERRLQGYTVFTSNVDGQFQKAGFAPESVHECHGSIHHLQCLQPCCAHIWPADDFHPKVDEARCLLLSELPTCPRCGGLARPNILMFGDWGWLEQRTAGQAARQDAWLAGLGSASRLLVIELGAGTAIPSVRYFSHQAIHEIGRRLIRINPAEAAVPNGLDLSLPMGALAGLEGIAALLGTP